MLPTNDSSHASWNHFLAIEYCCISCKTTPIEFAFSARCEIVKTLGSSSTETFQICRLTSCASSTLASRNLYCELAGGNSNARSKMCADAVQSEVSS